MLVSPAGQDESSFQSSRGWSHLLPTESRTGPGPGLAGVWLIFTELSECADGKHPENSKERMVIRSPNQGKLPGEGKT